MKKVFAMLLTLTLLVGTLTTTALAAETVTDGYLTISNVVETIEADEYNLYGCEEYATVTITEDIYWLNIYYREADGSYVTVSMDVVYGEEGLPVFAYDNVSVVVTDTNTTYTMGEYLDGVDAGEVDWNADAYITAGSSFDILYGYTYYAFQTIPLGEEESLLCEVFPDYDVATIEAVEETAEEIVEEAPKAAPTASPVYVDGAQVAFDAYNIDANNYFKLRDIACSLSGTDAQFNVVWDYDLSAISITTGEAYAQVGGEMTPGDGTAQGYVTNEAPIYLDGELVDLTAYTINGNNYFKLRDLGEALGFNVSWDSDLQGVVVASNEGYTAD